MKIMYVITQGTWGGAQSHVYSVIADQVRKGNKVLLITGKIGHLTKLVKFNLPTVDILIMNNLDREVSIFHDLKAIRCLRHIIRRVSPDIIHLHSTKAGMVGRLASMGLKVPTIYTVHGWAFTPGVTQKQKILTSSIEWILRPMTSVYICVSKFDYKLGVRKKIIDDKHPGIVIHNGVVKRSSSNKSNSNTIIITMAARFNLQKRQDLLISSLKYVQDNRIRLLLLGDGPLLEKNKRLAKKLGIADQIIFKGNVDRVQEYYKDSDIAVLISNYEGLPISLVEGLAQGLPIIASNVGGNSELVSNKNGILVNNSPKIIAQAIKRLVDNRTLRENMASNSLNLFNREYTQERMLRDVQKVYNKIE